MDRLKVLALIAALAVPIVLAGCETFPQDGRPAGSVQPGPAREPEPGRAPQRPPDPGGGRTAPQGPQRPPDSGGGRTAPRGSDRGGPPASQTCNPRRLVGVLVIFSNRVFVNTQPARAGQLICDGDAVSTDASGSADVVPEQDRESDSIHLAESTDPRFVWLPASGCLQIDRYVKGKIITTSRRVCMVVRTPDALILQATGRTQFTVLSAARTDVVPLSGQAIKLKPLSEVQTRTLARTQLQAEIADSRLQPLPKQLNSYSKGAMVQRSPLRTSEIEAIERSRIRTPIERLPGPAPAVPR